MDYLKLLGVAFTLKQELTNLLKMVFVITLVSLSLDTVLYVKKLM